MKRYFKHEAESVIGSGVAYIEFDDEWASRQVEIYGTRWFCSNREYHEELGPALADQPLSMLELLPEHEISREEFEAIWQKAQDLCD